MDPVPYMNRYSARVSSAFTCSSPELSADMRSNKITIRRSPVSRSLGRRSLRKETALFSCLGQETGRWFLGSWCRGRSGGVYFPGAGSGAAWNCSSGRGLVECCGGVRSCTDLRLYVPSGCGTYRLYMISPASGDQGRCQSRHLCGTHGIFQLPETVVG